MGSIESDGYLVSLEKDGTKKRKNMQECALMCGNMHKRATSAVRPPNFAVKTEAHGTETHRKEGGTSMGGENRE